MAPTYKSFEVLDLVPITRDGSLQYSPDGKYLSIATTDHIVIIQVNTDMLKVPIPNYFYSKTNIEINKSHGTVLANKIIPVKQFIRLLPVTEINRMVCDVRVGSEIFTTNADMKKFRWSPCAFASNQTLIGALNSLGFLEIIHCHNAGHSKLFKINELWYSQYVRKFVKMYTLPKLPSELKKIFMNMCSLLWIENFVWVPMGEKTAGLLLVCYHRRGVLTVWHINQRVAPRDPLVAEVPVFVGTVLNSPSLAKKSKDKVKTPEQASIYDHECNLVKIITDFCVDPFSHRNLIEEEFDENLDERVLNMEYINLAGRHTLCIGRRNGTLQLIPLNLTGCFDASTRNMNSTSNANTNLFNLPFDNETFFNETSNSVNSQSDRIKSFPSDSEKSSEKLVQTKATRNTKANKGGTKSAEEKTSGQKRRMPTKTQSGKKSKSEFSDDRNLGTNEDSNESNVQVDTDTLSDSQTKINNSVDQIDQFSQSGSQTKINSVGQSGSENETNTSSVGQTDQCSQSGSQTKINPSQIGDTNAGGTSLSRPLYDKHDRMPISNLVITQQSQNTILVFSKMSILHCIILNTRGKVIESFRQRFKTRTITAVARYRRNKYLVGTFENKLLVVRIDTVVAEDSEDDCEDVNPSDGFVTHLSSKKTSDTCSTNLNSKSTSLNKDKTSNEDKLAERIVTRRIIDLSSDTHTLNGVANSPNNFLTILSLRIHVRFETYYATSRNPCYLSLTSLHSPSSLTSELLASRPMCQQADLVKCIAYNGMNIVKNRLLDNITDMRTKYFFLKLFRPAKIPPKIESQMDATLECLEKSIYLSYVKTCVKNDTFRGQKNVLVLFREWICHNFDADSYTKLLSRLPTEPYEESCFLCLSATRMVSFKYALCSVGHRIPRCSLSLVQCLGSYVRCAYCLSYASTVFSEDTNMRCVFCDAEFPV